MSHCHRAAFWRRTVSWVCLGGLLGTAQAAERPASGDAGLATWAAKRIAERPGLPPLETRSPSQGALAPDPAQATLALLGGTVTAARLSGTVFTAPQAVSIRENDEVYVATFTAADGLPQEFAAHFRPDDVRPLYLCASGSAPIAGATYEQALTALVTRVLGGSTEGLRISARTNLVDAATTVLSAGRSPVEGPWPRYWLFFVDDRPLAGWDHPVRYVFMAPDLSAFAVQYERRILELFDASVTDRPRLLMSLAVPHPVVDAPGVTAAAAPSPSLQPLSINYQGSAQNCYAVILSGGADAFNNWARYWEDSAAIYTTLKRKYGLSDDHIIALISDGSDPANDRDIGTKEAPVYTNSTTDLDGDGIADTDGPCTLAEVQNAFDTLAGILTSNDQLFVFTTDHGYQESGWDAGINLWNWENLRDDQFAGMTRDLPCPVMVVMENCYSGGFVDDITNTPNRVIGAACAYNDTSEGWSHYDPFVYFFTAAVRGYYPGAGGIRPWDEESACNADGNADGRISFNEAWQHAYNNRAASDIPKLGQNPAGLGNSLFMNQLHIELSNDTPLTFSEVPKDFSFQVKDYDWAAVGIAPTTDHDLKADTDRRFGSPYGYSVAGSTTRDFIVYNGHTLAQSALHYAQVYLNTASPYQIEAEWEPADLDLGISHAGSLGASEVLDVYECYLWAGTTYDVTVNQTSGAADASLFVFSPSIAHASRSAASWSQNAGGAGADETVRFRATSSGYHGLVIVNENGGSGNYTVLVSEAPPLAAPAGVTASDGTYTNKIRLTWNAASGATHYIVYRNTLNNSGTASALNSWTGGTNYDDMAVTPGRTYYYWVKSASASNGDRESGFSATDGGYVDPPTLADDLPVVTTGAPAYYDCREGSAYWWVVGVRYNVQGENWSLRLYDTPGFNTVAGTSAWNTPVDFVVADGNHLASQYRGVEAYRVSGAGNATVEFEGDAETLSMGTNAPTAWPAGNVVRIYDLYLTGGTYRITLDVTAGTADLDIGLFGSQDGVYTKPREGYLTRSTASGAGTDESFTYTATGADWYGLCLWANDTNSANYRVVVAPLQAGLWEGDVSTDWHTPGNWNDGFVPDAADPVTIPGGAPRYPKITTTNAACSSLTIEPGASLVLDNRHLDVGGNLTVHGQLTLQSSTACQLRVGGDVFWEAGSSCAMTGSSEAYITGDWNFEQGAAVQLTGGYVEFEGTDASWIRVYEPNCRFGNLRSNKSGGGFLGLSALCTAPIVVLNLYQYSASALEGYSGAPLVIQGFLNNMGGHIRMPATPLVYQGSPAVALKPNTGDYLRDLVMAGPGTLALDTSFTNTLAVQGDVQIASGVLDANGMRLDVGGDWSNAVGAAGFIADSNTVAFVGVGVAQHIWGTNIFSALVDARSGGDQLILKGATTVTRDFTVGYQTAVWAPLTVQGTLDLSSPSGQLILWGAAAAQASRLNMGGTLLVWSGSLTANDLVNDGLYGYIDINGGHVTLTQAATGLGEWFDLHGTLHMTGGELDLAGGSDDHYWPISGTCTFTMNGGILDFQNRGWWIRSGFSGGITNGTLRCAGNVWSDTAAFAPAGGLLELYGPTNCQLRQVSGSTFPSLLLNKGPSARADVTTNLTLTGDVELRSGALSAGNFTISVAGSWSNSVGTAGFVEGTSTVRFYGTNAAALRSDETFYRLQLDKTYSGAGALTVATGRTVHLLNDLALNDGALTLEGGTTLDVDRDLLLAAGAGLNASALPGPAVHVGRHWSNLNADFDLVHGFNPGYGSVVTFDGGAITGDVSTAAAQETFNAFRVDRPSGTLRVLDAFLARGDVTLQNGSLSYSGGPFTHHVRGNLTIETGAAWYDTVSTVVFDGNAVQNLNHKSLTGWFKNLVVEKYTGIATLPLTLQSDVLLLGGGTLTVREGDMALNGHYVRCTGNVTVEDGGRLWVDPGAWVEVGGGAAFEVQSGGQLDIRGTPVSPAKITHHSASYALAFRSGSSLVAQDAIFEYMDGNGLLVEDGAQLVEPYTFHRCTFRNGVAGGTLLTLNTTQSFRSQHASFPTNPGGGASNVRKGSVSGTVDFVHADGAFAGESYDDDPLNQVNWRSGTLTNLSLGGPSVVTRGGTGTFMATPLGDAPLTPITYTWDVTGNAGAAHTHSLGADTNLCNWSTAGTKVVRVTASNETGTAMQQRSISVEDLTVGAIARSQIGGTNGVRLTVQGTGSGANYRVDFRPSLLTEDWVTAGPGGTNLPGTDHSTVWTDLGGPGRDVNTATSLFYRAVLLP